MHGDQPAGASVAWDGRSSAPAAIHDLLAPFAPERALRVVLQQITLRETGREAGGHEVIDAVVDVGGVLVALALRDAVRADQGVSARLDAEIERLRGDITTELGVAVDGLEVLLDADGARRVRIALHLELTPADFAGGAAPPALHDGAHHAAHSAPALDELRDRVAAPQRAPLRRLLRSLHGRLRPGR